MRAVRSDLTGARYAALGLLKPSRVKLERFITTGIDEVTRRRIGSPPCGRGVLGELISDRRPLRLSDVGAHPRSYGLPAGHPPMTTFLGVPVFVAGTPFGNLYVSERLEGGSFSKMHEQAPVRLGGLAGLAIDHCRRNGVADPPHQSSDF